MTTTQAIQCLQTIDSILEVTCNKEYLAPYKEALSMAQSALGKQTSQERDFLERRKWIDDGMIMVITAQDYCPVCKCEVDARFKYCPYCGQAIN